MTELIKDIDFDSKYGVTLINVHAQKEINKTKTYRVISVPTFVLADDEGNMINKTSGVLSLKALDTFITSIDGP